MAPRKAVDRSPPMARTPSVALLRSRVEPETPHTTFVLLPSDLRSSLLLVVTLLISDLAVFVVVVVVV
eukprot:m.274145 g.274145  ORF g.274145 m.274145 type:complete len:68 (-) comp26895_c2_seq2:505-708(-)